MSVKILVTGGTFDKEYDEIRGRLFFQKTHVAQMLKRGRCQARVRVSRLMMKDSLEMTDADRNKILGACRRARERRIIITHGTDTMVETARHLGEAGLNKTIILTGAMIPFAFGSSDGLFNLGGAVSLVQALPAGVYVAMNGLCFPFDNVRKNRGLGRFERARK